MTIEIKNRWTGAVLRMVEAESLRDADLGGADLSRTDLGGANLRDADLSRTDLGGANLRDADLSRTDLGGADLGGADLRDADLSGAYLGGANLGGADLRDADLSGTYLGGANLGGADLRDANLGGADLSGAYLGGADLRDADLSRANLGGANLSRANLSRANLTGVAAALGIDVDPALPGKILAQIAEHPESWCQSTWHTACGTRHCIAGFATHLSGALGRYMDRTLSTPTAATLLLWRPGAVLPSFDAEATEEETLGRLRVMAEAAERGE